MNKQDFICNNFNNIKISSLIFDFEDSYQIDKHILNLVDYFFIEGKLDILCIQGLKNNKNVKKIINIFETNKKSNIYYYPNIKNKNKTDTWSLTLDSFEDEKINKIIISKYKIKKSKSFINFDIIDIIYNDILLSIFNIYNIEENLQDFQNNLKNTIDSYNNDIKYFLYSNNLKYNLNILCGFFNLIEINNNTINSKYINLIENLNLIDIFRYINQIKKINNLNINYYTNISFKRNNFIFLKLDENIELDNNKIITEKIYEKYNLLILNCLIEEYLFNLLNNIPTTIFIYDKIDKNISCNKCNATYNKINFENFTDEDSENSNIEYYSDSSNSI